MLKRWKAFEAEYGANPMKWDENQKEQARELLTAFTEERQRLYEIDRQEAARFSRREMPSLEEF